MFDIERDCTIENRITKSFIICTLHTYKDDTTRGQSV